MPTLTVYPSGYDATNSIYQSISSGYPVTNGYADSSSTTLARINLVTGSQAESYFYYTFDLSQLPNGASINSVTCNVKASISSSSDISARTIYMATNTTKKGTDTTLPTSSTAFDLTVGTWTEAELRNACVCMYAKRSTTNPTTARYFRFYGATLTVDYTDAPSNSLYFKNNDSWTQVETAYKKINGSWVAQSDLTTVFQTGVNYKKGD